MGDRAETALSLTALQQIERAALQLLEAVRAARGTSVAQSPSLSLSPTVADVCNEFLLSKARAGRADRYLSLTLTQLTAFARGRERRPLASISGAEIEAWLHSNGWQPVTQRHYLVAVRTLFNFALLRGLVVANPALGVDKPSVPFKPPEIHSPDQVSQVLECARRLDPGLCRFMSIRYFAGLRGSEAAALSESEIKVERGFIEVTAANAKTRQRRLVAIEPNLAAWLELGGSLPLRDKWTRHWRLVKACGVPMPANVTRHSFVSYHLAHFGSASRTALEAGHSEAVLFRHYREVVTRDDAARFWQIRPA